jgi:hypothetical protein
MRGLCKMARHPNICLEWRSKNMLLKGSFTWRKFVHEICSTLSPVFTNILPAAHAVTCCDTTSSLFGIGKRSVFKVLKENPDYFCQTWQIKNKVSNSEKCMSSTSSSSMLLFLDICVFELRHILPAWHGQGLVQDNPCSKHIQPQIYHS